MTLYEIDQNIMALIDEDGEITNPEAFDELQITRSEKLEGIACWIKNLKADAAAIKVEEDVLAERRRTIENKIKSLSEFLSNTLAGQKFSTPRVSVSYRTSKALEIADNDTFVAWASMFNPSLLRIKRDPDKKAITDAINGGMDVPGAQIVERKSMQVK